MIVGEVCTCGATYEKFRAVGDDGHELTYASAREALRVSFPDDPDLWRSKGRGAVLRYWGEQKRAQWEVTHGYCAQVAQERATVGDTSFDVETFDNVQATPVKTERCQCDHCNPERWMRAAGLIKDTTTTRRTRTMKSKSTINLRRTLAAYTVRKGGDGHEQPLCAVEGCPSEGKPRTCPADGTRHGHGCIHYVDCHTDLVFRQVGGWKWICDEHYKVCIDARRAWESRAPISRVGCTCKLCASERETRGQDLCAGLQNGMGPCDVDHCKRGVACTTCQGAFVSYEKSRGAL